MRQNTQVREAQELQQASVIVVAMVEQAQDGEATRLVLADTQICVNVFAHGSNVTALYAGDQVLAALTAQGAVVMQRLRVPGERPQQGFSVQADGRLLIQNDKGITLKTDKAKIEIRADGRLFVDGHEIYAIADGKHRLQGATIELN